jgi:hypothetical protein
VLRSILGPVCTATKVVANPVKAGLGLFGL